VKLLVIFSMLLVMIVGCSNDSGQAFESVDFKKPSALYLLQAKLKENELFYRMDNNKLLYRHSDEVVVDKLIWETLREVYPSNRYTNSDEKYLLKFKSMLIERGVSFSESITDGKKYFVWVEADNNKVQLILDDILLLQSDDDIKKIIIKHKQVKEEKSER